jgi:hypothetical protein
MLQAYCSDVFAPLAIFAAFPITSLVPATSLTHAQLPVSSTPDPVRWYNSLFVEFAGSQVRIGLLPDPHAIDPRSAAEHTHQFAGHAAFEPSHVAVLPLRLIFTTAAFMVDVHSPRAFTTVAPGRP